MEVRTWPVASGIGMPSVRGHVAQVVHCGGMDTPSVVGHRSHAGSETALRTLLMAHAQSVCSRWFDAPISDRGQVVRHAWQ